MQVHNSSFVRNTPAGAHWCARGSDCGADAYCDFGLGEQNVALPAAWLQATVFVLDGTTLELRTTDGTVVLSAERD